MFKYRFNHTENEDFLLLGQSDWTDDLGRCYDELKEYIEEAKDVCLKKAFVREMDGKVMAEYKGTTCNSYKSLEEYLRDRFWLINVFTIEMCDDSVVVCK